MKPIFSFVQVLVSCMLIVSFISTAEAEGLSYNGVVNVSLIDLISNSKKYDGKLVNAEGFARVKFEGNALYMSRDDANYLIQVNAVWLDFDKSIPDPSQFNGKWVRVEGIFNPKRKGHLGVYPGTIEKVTRLELLDKYYNY